MADKKYEKPESFDALTAEQVAELRDLASAEIDELVAIEGDLTNEQLDRAEALMADRKALEARQEAIDAEAQARADRTAKLREQAAAKPEEPAGDEPKPADEKPEDAPEAAAEVVEQPAEVVEAPAEPEPVLASGQQRPTVAAAAAAKGAPAFIKKETPVSGVTNTIVAAANLDGFEADSQLDGLSGLAEAFLSRSGNRPSMEGVKPGVYNLSPNATRHGVARINRKGTKNEVSRDMSLEAQFAAIMAAGDESQLEKNSVIAAGGWCAPSETIYSLFSYHTNAGMLDLPEVTAARGGIQFTKGPDFMQIFGDADAGFIQTEAQAEAGEVKPCYALDCPPFEEVRLDAVGFCATAPLLTNAAYPELVRQVLDMLGTAHARRKSKYSIDKILASIGSAGTRVFAPVGGNGNQSGVADVLGGLELNALIMRQALAMDPNATIEGFAPYWARPAFRHELSRRLGLTDPFRITDADVDGWLALRNIRLQYVYDYQMLTPTTTGGTTGGISWPTDLDITIYPAGAYTRLTNDVIKLDAVYDHDLLTQNTMTAAFMEEGLAIANTRGFGRILKFKLNYEGAAGFPQIGAGAGVTFAAA